MSGARWHDLGPEEGFAPGTLRGALRAGHRLCVGRGADPRELFAMDDTCPHAGASLSEGMLDGAHVVCPLHAYGFETRTGHCEEDPHCSVRVYPVRVQEGVVQVQLEGGQAA